MYTSSLIINGFDKTFRRNVEKRRQDALFDKIILVNRTLKYVKSRIRATRILIIVMTLGIIHTGKPVLLFYPVKYDLPHRADAGHSILFLFRLYQK